MVIMPKELRLGENRAVDLAVVADGQILLVLRGDGGGWAVPGGMVEDGETDLDAMVRELAEETRVVVDQRNVQIVTNRIPVDDPRNRHDRWVTTALGFTRLGLPPVAAGGDDAADARWVLLSGCDDMDRLLRVDTGSGLYPAHRPLIETVAKAVWA